MSGVSASLRSEVAARAQGRCEYCLIHEDDSGFRHEVDHIVSRKHGGESSMANLAYSCSL
jgi:5-methylcytosine-specific restriction endonuclease McrA